MPSAGLSLVGFMDRDQAISHLREACIPPDPSDQALEAEWMAARAKLGAQIDRAGTPEILDLPIEAQTHMNSVAAGWPAFFAQGNAEFKLVEIAPLLAFQFTVDGQRSGHHCGPFSSPPTLDELLNCCIPIANVEEQLHSQQQPQSIVVKAKSLNVRLLAQGMLAPGIFGIHIGLGLPFVHVVRYNGKCYLHNGFHRTYGAAIKGATHIPCYIRDVSDAAAAGIKADGTTFSQNLLESSEAPTLAHFIHDRAHSVILRSTTRILHISWAEYGMYDE
jgi:hypothetical protein